MPQSEERRKWNMPCDTNQSFWRKTTNIQVCRSMGSACPFARSRAWALWSDHIGQKPSPWFLSVKQFSVPVSLSIIGWQQCPCLSQGSLRIKSNCSWKVPQTLLTPSRCHCMWPAGSGPETWLWGCHMATVYRPLCWGYGAVALWACTQNSHGYLWDRYFSNGAYRVSEML